jgi:hypothetical protein
MKKQHAYVIQVPKPHPKAYNPDRPITDLVRNQILHMSVAELHLEKRHRTGTDVHSIRTEREASEYIRHLTDKMHRKKRNKGMGEKKAKRSKPARGRKTRRKKKWS